MDDHTLSQEEIDALLAGTEPVLSSSPSETSSSSPAVPRQEEVAELIDSIVRDAAQGLETFVGAVTAIEAEGPVAYGKFSERQKHLDGAWAIWRGDVHETPAGTILYCLPQASAASLLEVLGDYGGDGGSAERADHFVHVWAERLSHTLSSVLSSPVAATFSPLDDSAMGSDGADVFADGDTVYDQRFDISIGSLQITLHVFVQEALVEALFHQLETAFIAPQAAPVEEEIHVSPRRENDTETEGMKQNMQSVSEYGNIDLLLDVQLQVTVELGRARMQIRDLLALGKGSVIELDKLAGESVEVYVNGKLLAKGEVVTIDENFGVKITDIVDRQSRLTNLR